MAKDKKDRAMSDADYEKAMKALKEFKEKNSDMEGIQPDTEKLFDEAVKKSNERKAMSKKDKKMFEESMRPGNSNRRRFRNGGKV